MDENNLNEQFRYTHSEFLRTMLFYLRTPAVTVDGFSKILADGADGHLNSKQVSSLDAIRRGSRDLHFLLDVFSYVIRFDDKSWNRVYGEGSKVENLSQIVDVALDITPSFGALRIDPSIDIVNEISRNLPSIKASEELLITIIRLMIMSAVYASRPCSKILIVAEGTSEWIDLHIVSNPKESYAKFDDLQSKYPFHNIYDSIDLEFKENLEKNPTGEFYPILLAIIHGLAIIHNVELRTKLSKSTSDIILRMAIAG